MVYQPICTHYSSIYKYDLSEPGSQDSRCWTEALYKQLFKAGGPPANRSQHCGSTSLNVVALSHDCLHNHCYWQTFRHFPSKSVAFTATERPSCRQNYKHNKPRRAAITANCDENMREKSCFVKFSVSVLASRCRSEVKCTATSKRWFKTKKASLLKITQPLLLPYSQ